jgi:hypothetical protein
MRGGIRELLFVTAVAVVGLVLAAIVALAPWYPGPQAGRTPIVTVVGTVEVADGR